MSRAMKILMPSLRLIAVVAAPGAAAMLFVWFRYGKPEPSILVNGLLEGLVASTASCAFVSTISAVIVGAIAGVLVVASVVFIEQVLKVDDPGLCHLRARDLRRVGHSRAGALCGRDLRQRLKRSFRACAWVVIR